MKIVMTGATGYIGKKIARRLSKEHEVIVIVRESSHTDDIEKWTHKVIQSEPYEKMYEKIDEIKPEIYINLAGVYYGQHDPKRIGQLLDANVILPTYVTDAVVAAGCKNVIHTASYQQSFQGEHYNPMNLYAGTKQAFEDILYYYTSSNQAKAITLQLFDTYGADDARNKVFNYVRRLADGEQMDMSPGMQKLYFCYIEDVVEAYVQAIELLKNQECGFNQRYAVRSEEPIALKEFVEKYIEQVKKKLMIKWGGRPYMQKEIMDPTGYGQMLPGWSAKVSYEEGLRLCSEYDNANA